METQTNILDEKTKILNEFFLLATPARWIVNFKNGSTITSKTHESFNDIPIEDRNNIVSFQLKIDENRFIINRKDENDNLINGFFYHIKEGRSTLQGKYPGASISFYAERIGFCYNSKGDSVAIRVNHSKLIDKISKRMRDEIEPLLESEYKENEIDELINKPLKYSLQSDFFHENIKDLRVNTALFGQLNQLEEMGTAPRSYMNNEEMKIVK